IVVDMVAVWTLWPSYRREWGERMLPRLRPLWSTALKVACSIGVLMVSLGLATFPGERVRSEQVAQALDVGIFGAAEGASSSRRGLFPNRLWLPSEAFVDDDKLKRLAIENATEDRMQPAYSVDLSGRNLSYAMLPNTDLRRVNLSGAKLTG